MTGKLINFNSFLKDKSSNSSSLFDSLLRISHLKSQRFIFYIDGKILYNTEKLKNILSEISLLRTLGIFTIIISDFNEELNFYLNTIYQESDIKSFLDPSSIVEMIIFQKYTKYISDMINSIGGCSIAISGKDGNMILGEKIEHEDLYSLYKIDLLQKINSYAVPSSINENNLLYFIEDSNIIPVICPVCSGKGNKVYFSDSILFVNFLLKNMPANRAIFITEDIDLSDFNANTISSTQLSSISTSNLFLKKVFSSAKNAFDFDPDYIHIIDSNKSNIFDEISMTNINSLLIYNDHHSI